MTRATAAGPRVEALDVLRGLAALAVVFFHMRVPLWVGWRELVVNPAYSEIDRALAWFSLPMPFFGSTVMLFFVVSGFVIHYPYAAPEARFELGPYATRRLLRIYPPYAVAVLLTAHAEALVAGWGGAPPSGASKVGASLVMAQNYIPPPGQMVGNPSLWSLPVEIELYLVYPILLWVWRRFGFVAMAALVTSTSVVATGALLTGHEWPMANFAKFWVIWAAGASLAEAAHRNWLPRWRRAYLVLAALCVVSAVGGRAGGLHAGIEHFAWGGFYTLVILWVLVTPAAVASLPIGLRSGLARLGDISYSLYLIHFPLLLVLGALWVGWYGSKPTNIAIPIAGALLTLPAAYVLWRWVEVPSQRLARRLAGQRNATAPVVAGVPVEPR